MSPPDPITAAESSQGLRELNRWLAARTAARSLLCACHRRGKGMRCTGCTVTALWQFFTQPPGGEAAPVLQLRTIRVPSLRGGFG